MKKKAKVETPQAPEVKAAVALLKIDKGIPAPAGRIYGASLEATLRALKPVNGNVKESESIEVAKENVGILKARMAKFRSGIFATSTNANGSKRVWKVADPQAV
jgi:hypothetical protein